MTPVSLFLSSLHPSLEFGDVSGIGWKSLLNSRRVGPLPEHLRGSSVAEGESRPPPSHPAPSSLLRGGPAPALALPASSRFPVERKGSGETQGGSGDNGSAWILQWALQLGAFLSAQCRDQHSSTWFFTSIHPRA